MRYTKGGLSEKEILKLPMSKFNMYSDYMVYDLRQGTDEGDKKNKRLDAKDRQRFGQVRQSDDDFTRAINNFKNNLK